MATDDFFRARLDQMIDLRHALAVLATRMPSAQIEASLAPVLAHRDRKGRPIEGADVFRPAGQARGHPAQADPRARGQDAAPAECIGKGNARQPYKFGVKVSLAVTHQHGLMVGARSFPGNPFDGHTLAAQIEQTTNLLQDIGVKPTTAWTGAG